MLSEYFIQLKSEEQKISSLLHLKRKFNMSIYIYIYIEIRGNQSIISNILLVCAIEWIKDMLYSFINDLLITEKKILIFTSMI